LQFSKELYNYPDQQKWNMKTINVLAKDAALKIEVKSNSIERFLVWGIWVSMFIFSIYCITKYGKNIPLAEDWLLVAPLTGNEPDMVDWLWAQNNEHRVPIPKLIFLVLLKLTNGDFRAGMYFNAIILGGISIAVIQVAHHIRGGKTKLVDAFVPVTLMHIGQWENLVWSWQISFVFPVALIIGLILIFITYPLLNHKTAVVYTTISLILLPLCGGIGIIFAPFLVLWVLFCGIYHWKNVEVKNNRKWVSILTVIIVGVYFIGYERPAWNPPSPSIKATLVTAAKFLALSIGPVAAKSWQWSILLSMIIVLPSIWIAAKAVLCTKGVEQFRALLLFLFFGNIALFTLAMGWGRAGLVPTVGLPIRYVLLTAPIFCTVFFIWELYGSRFSRSIIQNGLLTIMIFLIPYNTMMGFGWRNWYLKGMNAVENNLLHHHQQSLLAKEHRDFLIHWWDEDKLASHMQMLHENKIGPFSQMKMDSTEPQNSNIK
jgi:hypothetical protein